MLSFSLSWMEFADPCVNLLQRVNTTRSKYSYRYFFLQNYRMSLILCWAGVVDGGQHKINIWIILLFLPSQPWFIAIFNFRPAYVLSQCSWQRYFNKRDSEGWHQLWFVLYGAVYPADHDFNLFKISRFAKTFVISISKNPEITKTNSLYTRDGWMLA